MNPITGLSLARIGLGAAALASPNLAAKLFRLDAPANKQLPYMTRMFGSREVALGAVTLLAPRGARKRIVTLGMAVDGADAWAAWSAREKGAVDEQTGIFLAVPALGAVVAGAIGLLESGRSDTDASSA